MFSYPPGTEERIDVYSERVHNIGSNEFWMPLQEANCFPNRAFLGGIASDTLYKTVWLYNREEQVKHLAILYIFWMQGIEGEVSLNHIAFT